MTEDKIDIHERLNHVMGAAEEMIRKGLKAGSVPGCIAILVEVIKYQQQQIEALQQANSKLDKRTNSMQVVGGVFPGNVKLGLTEKECEDMKERMNKNRPSSKGSVK